MFSRFVHSAIPALVCGVLLASAGCGKGGPATYHVSGTVSFGEQPVPAGYILFQPDATENNTGPATMVQIEGGHYDTARGGMGTVGGPHIAVITGFPDQSNVAPEERSGQPLFRDARLSIDLPRKRSVQDLVVAAR